MDLMTFVAETLRQIVKGVSTAQQHDDCKLARINSLTPFGCTGKTPEAERIEFDVAVIVTEGSESREKDSLGVASYVANGGEKSASNSNSSVSRVKFGVPVILPTVGNDN